MNKNLFLKMLFIFLIPSLGMLFFTGNFVKEKIIILNNMDVEKKSVEYLRVTEVVLNNLQKERGLSAAFLASDGNNFKKELNNQRKQSDKVLESFKNIILKLDIENPKLENHIKDIQVAIFSVIELRVKVDSLAISIDEDIKKYTSLNNKLIESLNVLLSNELKQDTFKDINSLLKLIKIKDLAGIERAIFMNIFVNKNLDKQQAYKYVQDNIKLQEENIKDFVMQTTLKNTTLFYNTLDSKITNKVQEYRNLFLKEDKLIENPLDWWKIATLRIETFGDIIKKISNNILQNSRSSVIAAKRGLILSLFIWIVGITGIIISVLMLRNIIKMEKKNYENLVKQKQLYNVLSKTNELIIHDYKMDEVFQNVCNIIVDEVDLSLAFIGMIDADQNIKVVASTGKQALQEYISKLNLTIKHDKSNTLGLAAKAIVEARNIIVDNVIADKTSLLVDLAHEHQLNSAGAYPLVQNNAIVGVMVIYAKDFRFFEKDIGELFERMSGYLSFGLAKEVQKKLNKLYEEEIRISSYAFESQEAMVITDKDANIIKINKAFTKITGYKKDDVLGKNPSILKSQKHGPKFFKKMWKDLEKYGRWNGEIYNKHKGGKIYPLKTTITAIKDYENNTTHYIGQFYDISDIKESEEKLLYQARHDNLTGLPNRMVLKDRLEQAIKSAKRHEKIGALMFIDLDNFKYINDNLGHDTGDELLKVIAKILERCVREEDSVVRFGGDEFLILVTNLSSEYEDAKKRVSLIANKIREEIDVPLNVGEYELTTTPSIGITFFPSNSVDTNDIIKQADIAMYKAKDAGKNSIQFFTPQDN